MGELTCGLASSCVRGARMQHQSRKQGEVNVLGLHLFRRRVHKGGWQELLEWHWAISCMVCVSVCVRMVGASRSEIEWFVCRAGLGSWMGGAVVRDPAE